ncbi:hypothetical protein Bca101_102063 [Brassica carinata]
MIGRADIEGSKSSVAMSGLAATSQLSLCRIPLVVPVLSWLFGAGKLERAVPSPSPADTRRSLATLAAQAAANSRRVELGPRAQPSSQSFSKGCSPWRPDAVMSATGRGGFRSSVFKGAGMHGHHAACGALPAAGPYLRLSRFRSGQASFAPIPKSGERFASVSLRASTRVSSAARSGIVHHLSGPDSMLTLEPFSEDQGRSAVHREDQPISFLTPYGFTHPLTRTHVRLLGPCFKAGRMGAHRRRHEHADARRAVARAAEPRLRQRRLAGPWAEFTARLGLHSQTTRLVDSACVVRQGRTRQGSHPLWRPFPGTWARSVAEALLRTTIRAPKASDFQAGLFGSLAVTKGILRVIRLTWGRVEDFGSSRAFGRSGGDLASEFTTACQGAPGILSSDFGQRRAVTRETSFRPISSRGLGAAICDTQAGVPSARRLGAQLAFKDFDGSRDSAIHTKYRISLRGGTTRPVKARCVSPDRRDRPTGAHEGGRATHPKVQLRAFNCNNLNIRYWSWNYAAAGTRLALQWILVKGFRLYSFQLPDSKSRYCYLLSLPPVSGLGNLRAAAFLGCGSRFSGSLSESNPNSPSPVTTMDQPGSIHKSRQALVMFRKHMERGTGEDLAVIFCQETSVLSRTEFLESPP